MVVHYYWLDISLCVIESYPLMRSFYDSHLTTLTICLGAWEHRM